MYFKNIHAERKYDNARTKFLLKNLTAEWTR